MKKAINKKIEISAVLALSFVLSFTSFNFVLADNASSAEDSSSSEKLDTMKHILGKNKDREEMTRKIEERKAEMRKKIDDKRTEIKHKMMKIKDMNDRLDGRLEERKNRLGTTTFSTSTAGFDDLISSTTPFRKKELEKIKKESEKIAERLGNSVKKLEDFYGRISEKVRKFEKKSVSNDEVKSLLGIARLKIDSAKSDVDNLVKAVGGGIGDQNKKDYLALIKNLSTKAKDSIHDAQKALSDAVSSLKPGFNKDKNSSSSSSAISSVSSSTASSATSSSSSSL